MLELYHSINSVCTQKVRMALNEKGLEAKEHLMTLGGDQFDPAYIKLNPNAVVPTLVHDGYPVVESSVILYYLEEVFPEPPLMPRDPKLRATGGFITSSLTNTSTTPA
jgi:glutathione S-transferase